VSNLRSNVLSMGISEMNRYAASKGRGEGLFIGPKLVDI